jgi:hypothetical protein
VPGKPGLAKPVPAEDAIQKSRREKDELEGECQAVEEELEALKARYDQYFLGIERREPNRWRDEVRKKVMRLKTAFTRNTGLKFRIQSLHARYLSYERLWLRSSREKEEGTYRRDLFKARLRAHHDEAPPAEPGAADRGPPSSSASGPGTASAPASARKPAAPPKPGASPAAPPVAAGKGAPPSSPRAPAVPARPEIAAAASGPGGMSETQMRALYDSYVAAKRSCREDVSRLTYDAVAKTVSRQIPELMTRYRAKSVEFRVEVKDGKAVLKAVPKV